MLVAQGLVKAYRGTTVVEDVDLELVPGRVLGLVGANGAGKTTTIKMLGGLIEPTHGHVTLDGAATTEPRTRTEIGFLPENSPLYDEETPVSYLRFFGTIYEMEPQAAETRGRDLLERLGLDEAHWTKPIGKLSKGMKRKVAIARTVLHDPSVLLLDEPTSGLDPVTQHDLSAFIGELAGQGKAILLSAHDLRQVEELCDDIVIMHEGRVATRGTLDELRTTWGKRAYHLHATVPFPGSEDKGTAHHGAFESIAELEKALTQVRETGGEILEIEALAPRLEEIVLATARS